MTTTTTTISGGILPKEYQDLRDTVADFARTVVAPVSAKHDAEHSFPYEIVAKMGEMGLFGLPFPEEYGGMGGDYFALSLVLEELGKVDQSVAITLEAAVGLGAMPIYRFGTEEQKQKWLPDLTSGRALAGFGLTEPGAGSDAGSTRTTARLEGDEWIINGSKQFITNSGTDITSLVTVTAVTGTTGTAADAKKEISTIIVPSGTPGFTVEPVYNKVGWNASDTHPLTFADARVPRENLLGARGSGYANFLSILDEGRIAIAALATGAAQGCVDESVKYANQRQSFGQPIGAYQAIGFKIARMEARAHVAAHHVLRPGYRNHQRRTGFRHRLRADWRWAAGQHRPGGPPHLRRGVWGRGNRAGIGDGGGAVRHPGRCHRGAASVFPAADQL